MKKVGGLVICIARGFELLSPIRLSAPGFVKSVLKQDFESLVKNDSVVVSLYEPTRCPPQHYVRLNRWVLAGCASGSAGSNSFDDRSRNLNTTGAIVAPIEADMASWEIVT